MMFNKSHYFFVGSILLSSCLAQASFLDGEEKIKYLEEMNQSDQESLDNALHNPYRGSQFESFHPISELATPVKPSLHSISYTTDCIEAIKKRIIDGADLNEMDSSSPGLTPLIKALIIERQDITKLLLEKGASVNQPDKVGCTPIKTALKNGPRALNLVKLILDYNPQLNFEDKPIGQTPLAYAIAWNKEAVIFLLQKGAILKPEHFELSNAINLVDALNHKLGFVANNYNFHIGIKRKIMKENLIKRADLIKYLKTDKKIKKSVGLSFIDFKGEYQTIVDELAAQPEDKLFLSEGPTLKLFS